MKRKVEAAVTHAACFVLGCIVTFLTIRYIEYNKRMEQVLGQIPSVPAAKAQILHSDSVPTTYYDGVLPGK